MTAPDPPGKPSAESAPTVVPFGDGALLVVLGEEISPALNWRVHERAAAIRERTSDDSRWGLPVPGYGSLLLPYDPLKLSQAEATDRLERLVASDSFRDLPPPRAGAEEVVDIPVRYGGDDGPDLDVVADAVGLTPGGVVALHAQNTYDVLLLGFAPGFAYLGMLPPELAVPRRATPRTRVPSGSVAIAGRQTAVYPSATAGGWHVIGRTDLVMWDLARDPPALLRPGQRVRFRPVRN